MKADYVHKDSKTSTAETGSYKITMPLIDTEELQRIDNHYNELVDEFLKQFVKEKDMIIAQQIMMNLRKENEQLHIENQKLKEMQCTFLGTGCQNKMKKYKEAIDKVNDINNRIIEEYKIEYGDSPSKLLLSLEMIEKILKEVE